MSRLTEWERVRPYLGRALALAVLVGLAIVAWIGLNDREPSESSNPQPHVLGKSVSFWEVREPRAVSIDEVTGPGGTESIQVSMEGRRQLFTVVQHNFPQPTDWSGFRFVFLYLRQELALGALRFVVDFNADHSRYAYFDVRDSSFGWKAIRLDLSSPTGSEGRPNWRRVHFLRVAALPKGADGAFTLGRITLVPEEQ